MFNKHSRTKNAFRLSTINSICNVINLLMGFAFRALFIRFLSVSYLGINGVFSSVLTVLHIADIGIISCIIYRFYVPISTDDVKQVGRLLNYLKRIYLTIAITMFSAGLLAIPLIPGLFKSQSEIPADINLYVVYILFLSNTVSSYLFSYSHSLLHADQRGFYNTLFHSLVLFVSYTSRLAVIALYKNYTISLLITTILNLLFNMCLTAFVKRSYREVFEVKEDLPKEEKKQIIKDSQAVLIHRIGSLVVGGTDSILITKMIGLIECGLYSNYTMIINGVHSIINNLLGSFTSSIGNANVKLDEDRKYAVYRRMFFANSYITGTATTCLYILIDGFIIMWLGYEYLLDNITVIILAVCFYIPSMNNCTGSFLNATGLFIKDRIRPLIEATINLVVSIVAAKRFGLKGIFMGTFASQVCTYFWRNPHILYRDLFKSYSVARYWLIYFVNAAVTVLSILVSKQFISLIFKGKLSIFIWLVEAVICVLCFSVIFVLFHLKDSNLYFYLGLGKKIEKKIAQVVKR